MTRISIIAFLLLAWLGADFADPADFGAMNYDELASELKKLKADFPGIIQTESLSKTATGRDLWLATVSGGKKSNKPAILIVAGVEGPDVASAAVLLDLVRTLGDGYGRADSITRFLDRHTLFIVPRLNPDASEQLSATLRYDRFLNASSLDLDHDGAVDEDGYEDLNGDGMITMMRVRDPLGEWLADPLDPQLMRRANPAKNEQGEYRLLREGIDNDGDGRWNEDENGGVAMNRNFTHRYEFFEPGAGLFPLSETESRSLVDFMFAHDEIGVVISFTGAANLITPWRSAKAEKGKPLVAVLPKDDEYYAFLSKAYKKIFNSQAASNPPVKGSFAEWAYYHFGRWSLSLPVWMPAEVNVADSSKSDIKDDPIAQQRRLYHWILEQNDKSLFIPWQEINHPDFPDAVVEVGGFAPGVQFNPPADSLEGITDKFAEFIFQIAKYFPSLELTLKSEAMSADVFRITAVVKNAGYLPTNSELGSRLKWVRKVKTEIVPGEGWELISGKVFYLSEQIVGGAATEYSWLVRGKGGEVVVKSGSPTVGFTEKRVILK